MSAASMIPWLPIDAIPDDLKDGRPVLLWTDWPHAPELNQAVTARWEDGRWGMTNISISISIYPEDNRVLGVVTHYAVIEAPSTGAAN